MFNEKNIPILIILTPIFSILILVSILLYYLIDNQQTYFEKENTQFEKEYVFKQKEILKKEINGVIKYINYQRNLLIENSKKNIKIQMNAFLENIKNGTINNKEYKNYVLQNANSNTDFIIFDIKDNRVIKDKDVFFFYETLDDFKKILKNKNEVFKIEDETNIYFFKYIKDSDIIIVLKKDIFYLLDDLKYNIARWVEYINFGKNNYFWIHTNTNILISHGKRKNEIGIDDTNKKDFQDNYYVQNLVRIAIKNKNGAFSEFYSIEDKTPRKKLAFVKLYNEWNWIIGSGIFLDEINSVISNKKRVLENRINKYIQTAMVISFLLIIFISILSLFISQKINLTFLAYQKKVKKKELRLKNLNKNLNTKIANAIKEVKAKDRAMFHQSRHARMGEMLSMISHQWRQPLSRLSGILMEIETKVIFKKYDEQFLLDSADDATHIIDYMSNTIEDFKNFFKPEKEKEEFLVSKACDNAISLLKDSFQNQKINLNYRIIKDKKIKGYPREYSQVILNLLLNAKDALLSNNIKNPHINLIVNTYNNQSLVIVSDNAKGIKEEDMEKIFEPYYSTKSKQGTGLGLYMSKSIIEKNMFGSLTARNNKYGAIFRVLV